MDANGMKAKIWRKLIDQEVGQKNKNQYINL